MKVFRAADKQYDAEYHLYKMVEAIKKLSKDDLQEFANASPVFEDAVHLANRLGKYQAKQFEALVQEVAPMQKLSFGVEIPKGNELENILEAKAEEEESEQEKPVFEEMPFCTKELIENAIDCTGGLGNASTIEDTIDYLEQGKILLLSPVSFENLKSHLGSGTYCFYQSREVRSNKLYIVLWEFKGISNEEPKPIFEEAGYAPKTRFFFIYPNDDAEIESIVSYIDEQNKCVCINEHIYTQLKKKLKGEKYLFHKSKRGDDILIFIWKAAT